MMLRCIRSHQPATNCEVQVYKTWPCAAAAPCHYCVIVWRCMGGPVGGNTGQGSAVSAENCS